MSKNLRINRFSGKDEVGGRSTTSVQGRVTSVRAARDPAIIDNKTIRQKKRDPNDMDNR